MKKAFTLIEMVIVIVLLGILAAIIVPSQTTYIASAKSVQAIAVQKNFSTAFTAFQNLSESSSTQVVKNDHNSTGLTVVFSGAGIAQTDALTSGTPATLTPTDVECSKLLQAFGNIAADDVGDVGDGTKSWTVTVLTASTLNGGATQDKICKFTHNESGKSFTYNNTSGTVSALS